MPCYVIYPEGGGKAFLCGDLGPHCGDVNCADVGTYLCDYPVGDGKTCDMPLCHGHAFEVAPEIHNCHGHALMWREFKESGGVKRELENVVPYKGTEQIEVSAMTCDCKHPIHECTDKQDCRVMESITESSASPACSTPYLLALKPAYAMARGMFSRPEHKGYTNSLDEAGRFTEADALQAQQAMPDKYVAIPVKA